MLHDISHCASGLCPHRSECRRHIDNYPGMNPRRLWFADFAPDEDGHCPDFWPKTDNPKPTEK